MTIRRPRPRREHLFGGLTRASILAALSLVAASALLNLAHGTPTHPPAFAMVLAGLALFAMSKLSVIRRGPLVSVGTGPMTNRMAIAYRAGYSLMAVGLLATFA